MQILINGEQVDTQATLLSDLVEPQEGIALALNEQVIPKKEWGKTEVKQGDKIEVITPFQGG